MSDSPPALEAPPDGAPTAPSSPEDPPGAEAAAPTGDGTSREDTASPRDDLEGRASAADTSSREDATSPGDGSPEAEAPARERTPRKRGLRRRVKKAFARVAIRCLAWVLPPFYVAYMWFVHATSKVEHLDTDLLWLLRERYGALVGVLWHQEVFTVAYAFRRFEGHTLASQSDFGTLITALLESNGFVVFRGGSSSSKTRRRKVLPELIDHMQSVEGVAYGITCDGSQGPMYQLKRGSVQIAHVCHKPMIVSRTWAKRRIDLPGWDRPFIPLPFNHIVQAFAGPYFVPEDASEEQLEVFRIGLENELLEITHWVHERLGEAAPPEGRRDFPPGWTPTWSPDALPRYAFDPPLGHSAAEQTKGEPIRARPRQRQADAVARSMGAWPTRAERGEEVVSPPERQAAALGAGS